MIFSPVNLSEIQSRNLIPSIIHMIWVGPNKYPDTLLSYIERWQELMPEWTIRLWTNDDINEKEFDETALDLIHRSNTGVQKADIMKYFIVKKYGGVYLDADVEPHQSLNVILYQPYSVLVCHDLNVSWAYMAVGFFAASPENQILTTCCNILKTAELNNGAPHMHTGPRVMGRALFEFSNNENVGLLPIKAFYRNMKGQHWIDGSFVQEDDDSRVGSHLYAKMWD